MEFLFTCYHQSVQLSLYRYHSLLLTTGEPARRSLAGLLLNAPLCAPTPPQTAPPLYFSIFVEVQFVTVYPVPLVHKMTEIKNYIGACKHHTKTSKNVFLICSALI